MAENNVPAEAPKKGKLKLIIMLVLVVLLAIGLSIAGTFWFLSKDDPDTPPGDAAEVVEVFAPNQYHVIEKPLVATIQAENRTRYAQIYLAFEAQDVAPLEATNTHLPLLRSRLLSVLGGQSFNGLQTVEGRDQLIAAMLASVNGVLEQEGEPPVSNVLFLNFVLQ
ncbi:MAG: flagellar basal body-associated FliL family protein [Marinobacter sp.]|uniref:flagellar basal body-associated protein FliL n=1 Tax=Marinobacter sp. TaxID=50741 RepID=UPI0034A04D03